MFGACASSSTIQPASKSKSGFEGAVYKGEEKVVTEDNSGAERYRVFEHGATGFVSLQSVRETAEQRANQFCDKQGKWAKTLIEHTSTPPHILGNFPRVELIFVCADKAATAGSSTFEDQRYIKLMNLKKLLDSGVITKEEFEREKAKILADH
jgi:putative oligomerization/nucleic acid binding protein